MKTKRFGGILQILLIMSASLLIFNNCNRDEVIICDADIYEPNNSFDNSFSMGIVDGEIRVFSACISLASDIDFYKVTATEGEHFGMFLSSEYFRITFELVPPSGKDYDLFIYNESGTLLDQSGVRGSDEEVVVMDWEGTLGLDDSNIFGIEVRPYSEDWDCKDYTLTVTMLYSDSPW